MRRPISKDRALLSNISIKSLPFGTPRIGAPTVRFISTGFFISPLRLLFIYLIAAMTGEVVIACDNCRRQRQAFDQWGSATTDAKNRVYCSYECAWTILIGEDQVYWYHSNLLASTSNAPARKRLTKRRKPKSPSTSASSKSNDITHGVKEWNALFGISAILGIDN